MNLQSLRIESHRQAKAFVSTWLSLSSWELKRNYRKRLGDSARGLSTLERLSASIAINEIDNLRGVS